MRRKSENPEKILAFVRRYRDEHGYPPVIREIAAGCAIPSQSTVHYWLTELERRGYIRRAPGIARSIVVLGPEGRS